MGCYRVLWVARGSSQDGISPLCLCDACSRWEPFQCGQGYEEAEAVGKEGVVVWLLSLDGNVVPSPNRK